MNQINLIFFDTLLTSGNKKQQKKILKKNQKRFQYSVKQHGLAIITKMILILSSSPSFSSSNVQIDAVEHM
jgi:hypothetical protein